VRSSLGRTTTGCDGDNNEVEDGDRDDEEIVPDDDDDDGSDDGKRSDAEDARDAEVGESKFVVAICNEPEWIVVFTSNGLSDTSSSIQLESATGMNERCPYGGLVRD
jgi:hypothetical protein